MPKYFEFEVSLLEIQARIWRRFQLTCKASPGSLDDSIQDAFGWPRKHLYEFRYIHEEGSVSSRSVQQVRLIAKCRQEEILDDKIIAFADDMKLVSFLAGKDDRCQ